ncbi:MAG: FAD binding domain-containing protein [Sphaerochaetaceae bacterium]|jgi:putative selenate reductase FAD-binding subunit|nr:FAD binding domain-containing protein [Sphaerochaetaceae bacterium]MDD4219365.1 FAD binding domain-containing protein [Sphaerochaetaceae bacterium]MDY0371518.1 FAD binding domain-containing protein [Sphaerochaetaceae bacterium]
MITEFIRATSPQESLEAIQKAGDGTVFLAGGTEIQRLGSAVACTKVVSLTQLQLSTIEEKDEIVSIGALVTFQEALESDLVPEYIKEALRYCGSRTRRNMATIGGNIALARDDSYLFPTLIAAKARLILGDIANDGKYTEENIPIREYHSFREHFAGSLILGIVLNKPNRFVASRRYARTVQSPAAVTISFGADTSSGSPHDIRICAAIKGSGVVRLLAVENGVLNGQYHAPEDAATQAALDIAFVDDITGSAAYKKYLLGTAVSELYRACLETLSVGGAV